MNPELEEVTLEELNQRLDNFEDRMKKMDVAPNYDREQVNILVPGDTFRLTICVGRASSEHCFKIVSEH